MAVIRHLADTPAQRIVLVLRPGAVADNLRQLTLRVPLQLLVTAGGQFAPFVMDMIWLSAKRDFYIEISPVQIKRKF